eukprot:scaffold42585_cov69-Phaeocystis_antarctica.AAC.2
MRAVDQSRIYFSRRMGSRRPSDAVPGSQHLGSSLVRRSGKLSVQKRSKAKRVDERSGFLVRAAHPEDISSLAPLLRVFKYTPAVFCVSTLAAPVWFPVPSFEGGFERLVFPTA